MHENPHASLHDLAPSEPRSKSIEPFPTRHRTLTGSGEGRRSSAPAGEPPEAQCGQQQREQDVDPKLDPLQAPEAGRRLEGVDAE
jgi:hypothetical protein